jgi:hypothetical protein
MLHYRCVAEFVKRLLTLAISTPPAADCLLGLLAHVAASQQVELPQQ